MVAVRGDLYAVEPNHGELDKITPDGQVSRVVDISASQGHIVPTSVAYHGNFYVGNLNTFPIEEGSSKIYKITPSGQIEIVAEGLTTVLGVAFDAQGTHVCAGKHDRQSLSHAGNWQSAAREQVGCVGNYCVGPHPSDSNDLRARWQPLCLQRWLRSASRRTGTSPQDRINGLMTRFRTVAN